MSGGSMNYLYRRVEEDATFIEQTPERRAFRKHLKKIAEALRAIEWNDSGDGASNEEGLIRACLSTTATLETATEAAREALTALRDEVARVEGAYK
jgi:phage shock protein A